MRAWLGPIIFGLLVAGLAFYASLVAVPRGIMRVAIDKVSANGGINRMVHAPLATDKARAIVRPSPDLAYSVCAYDLSDGPVIVTAAPVAAPYWSLSVFDARTDAIFVRNNQQWRAPRPLQIVLARRGDRVPTGVETIYPTGKRGIALIRIFVPDRAAFAAIDAARRAGFCGVEPSWAE